MSFDFLPPVRQNQPLLIGLSGGSGSGKTYSACLVARGLALGKPFAFIDTENGRGLHYADFFPDMRHTELRAPYSPARYSEAIKDADAAGFPVIVVDSGSHEYEGEGGVLRIQEAEFARLGGRDSVKMLSWVKPKTEHKAFVRQLLQTRAHVILCMRAEDKIEIVDDPENPGKKKAIAKPSLVGADGWIPIMEKRLPFELTLSLLLTPAAPGVAKPIKLQEQHRAFVPLDRPLDEEVGRRLGEWAAGGSVSGPVAGGVEGPRAETGAQAEAENGNTGQEVGLTAAGSLTDENPEPEAAVLERTLLAIFAKSPKLPNVKTQIGENRAKPRDEQIAWLQEKITLASQPREAVTA